jgi:CBS domain-containing protein
MKVKEIMTSEPGFCYGMDSVAMAALIMWQRDCGAVPVVDGENKVTGIVTDRDICIAVASREQKASEIKAGELCSGAVLTVLPDDDIKKVVKLMRRNQIRRLPVTDEQGRLQGMVTLADIIAAAGAKKKSRSARKKIFSLIAAISKKPPIRLSEIVIEDAETGEVQGADILSPDHFDRGSDQ